MEPTDYKRIATPINCSRCHGVYTYYLLAKYSEIRQTCIYGDICNDCLTTDEKGDMIIRLNADESIVQSNKELKYK